jgi:hypothetical protein
MNILFIRSPEARSLTFAAAACLLLFRPLPATATEGPTHPMSDVIGMYVIEVWPYKHPYAARTWTVEDWRGYASGLKKIGYNTIMIWPMLESMPDPLTPSDRASLQKHQKVIDILHRELGMRVLIFLCPNNVANKAAANTTFEMRHFFWSQESVDPSDPAAMRKMMAWREKLFSYFRAADGVAIIDSDPGGYPNSTNAEFVSLIKRHRDMLDRLRPGIELDYWPWWGWQGTMADRLGTEEEFADTFERLKKLNPEPWGILNGLQSDVLASLAKSNRSENAHYVEKSGLGSRAIALDYGAVEFEPSLPMTSFGGDVAYRAGATQDARGVMGNAQTHVAQLPSTFAFVRGALGKSRTDGDYVRFASGLVPGYGHQIVDAWKALSGTDSSAMRIQALGARRARSNRLEAGPLRGLLFGDPQRFMLDLALQLELKSAYQDLLAAQAAGRPLKSSLQTFSSAFDAWQERTGYESLNGLPGMSGLPSLDEALRKLNSPGIDAVLNGISVCQKGSCPPGSAQSDSEVMTNIETYTRRLGEAVKNAPASMPQ